MLLLKTGLKAAAVLAAVTLGSVFAQQAIAGCGQYTKVGVSFGESDSSFSSPSLMRAGLIKVSETTFDREWEARIVGLWHFVYLSKDNSALKIPPGAELDGGNTTWYADGNELTSSEVRDPATGSICLGIWKQTGESSYELNHIGLSWDPVGKAPAGPAFIKQYIWLAPGANTYFGTVTITQYLPDGKTVATKPVDGVDVPLIIHGTIKAVRVHIDTTTQPPVPVPAT